jgi:hypothetical protein
LSFEEPLGYVKDASKCPPGEWALYENAPKFEGFCSAFMSVHGPNEEIYIGSTMVLTPPIFQEPSEFHNLWVGNRHVVCPNGHSASGVRITCVVNGSVGGEVVLYSSRFEEVACVEDFIASAKSLGIPIHDYYPLKSGGGSKHRFVLDLDLCFDISQHRVGDLVVAQVSSISSSASFM